MLMNLGLFRRMLMSSCCYISSVTNLREGHVWIRINWTPLTTATGA